MDNRENMPDDGRPEHITVHSHRPRRDAVITLEEIENLRYDLYFCVGSLDVIKLVRER